MQTLLVEANGRGRLFFLGLLTALGLLALLYPLRKKLSQIPFAVHIAQSLPISIAVAWLVSRWEIFGDGAYLLPRDNFKIHYSFFLYVTESLKYLGQFPNWVYSNHGGMWIEPLANNYLFLLPYRILGSLAGATTTLSLNTVYKIAFLWVGQGTFLFGLYFLARRLYQSAIWASVIVGFALLSPITLGVLHQEHILGAVLYLPFLWLVLLDVPENPKRLILAAGILGLAMNQNYPQQLLIYLMLVAIAATTASHTFRAEMADLAKRLSRRPDVWIVGLAVGAFALSASPVIYSFLKYQGRLAAPDRFDGRALLPPTFADYKHINLIHFTSVLPENLTSYLGAGFDAAKAIGPLDEILLHFSPCLWLILTIAFWRRIPYRGFQLLSIGLLGLAAIGIYGPLPRLLYPWFPGIKIFRQWYHFLEILNPHLLFLAGFALKDFIEFTPSNRKERLALAFAGFGLGIGSLIPGVGYAYTLLPAILCAFKASPFQSKPRIAGLLFLWVGLGAFQWSQKTATTYQAWLSQPGFPLESENAEAFARKVLQENRGMLGEILVTPKAIGKSTAAFGGIRWAFGKNQIRSATPNEIGVSATGDGFNMALKEVPEGAESLIIGQYNDGRWRKVQDRISETFSSADLNLRIPLAGKWKSFSLQRTESPWRWLVLFMWLPVLGSVVDLLIDERARSWAIKPRADCEFGTSL